MYQKNGIMPPRRAPLPPATSRLVHLMALRKIGAAHLRRISPLDQPGESVAKTAEDVRYFNRNKLHAIRKSLETRRLGGNGQWADILCGYDPSKEFIIPDDLKELFKPLTEDEYQSQSSAEGGTVSAAFPPNMPSDMTHDEPAGETSGWTCNVCFFHHPENHLQCGCGNQRPHKSPHEDNLADEGTDSAAAGSYAVEDFPSELTCIISGFPPSNGVRFLIRDENDATSNQVFDLSYLLRWIFTEGESGNPKVKHPITSAAIDRDMALEFVTEVSEEEQNRFNEYRKRNGVSNEPPSLEDVQLMNQYHK